MQVLAELPHWIGARRCGDEIASINSSETTSGVRSFPSGLLSDFPAAFEFRIQYPTSDTEVMNRRKTNHLHLFSGSTWVIMIIEVQCNQIHED